MNTKLRILGLNLSREGRIGQLLELVNIRDQALEGDSVRAARFLSRISLSHVPGDLVSPEAVAGLALLALLPRVKGQPVEDRVGVGFGWLAWVLGMVVLFGAALWGWWMLADFGIFGRAVEFFEMASTKPGDPGSAD